MIRISHYNILLADDEFYLRESLKRKIAHLDNGFQVVAEASNGEEALSLLKSENIHLVITDIRMPVMDGLELSKKIRELYPDILTIVLTGYADFEYAQQALRQGVADYLLKPVTEESLESSLGLIHLTLQKTYELPEDAAMIRRSAEESVEYALLYMREHYMEDLDIGTLAGQLGFTSAYLTKLFNRYSGDSPIRHLTNIRIHEAKRLLLDTSLPISKIGEMVGYPDQFHFSKTFRKLTGCNPSSYRRNPSGTSSGAETSET